MKINNISQLNTKYYKNINKKDIDSNNNSISFEGKGSARVSAALLAAVLGIGTLTGCSSTSALPKNETMPVSTAGDINDVDKLDNGLAITFPQSIEKIALADISLMSMPISEFYALNSDGITSIAPDKDVYRNNSGSVIVTITNMVSDRKDEGSTLSEIINKVYSEALSEYNEEERVNIFNKIIDETVQANPNLAEYINEELGMRADSYSDIANLNLYNPFSPDSTSNLQLLLMPSEIVYEKQAFDNTEKQSYYTSTTYAPSFETASVVNDKNNLSDNEFSSFSEMIYGIYGKDLSDEAYRDILYSIVNDPNNSELFERNLNEMNFNDILNTDNVTDLNRTLSENISGSFIDITLPVVVTFRTNSTESNSNDGSKNSIIYQISPASVVDGQDDRAVKIVSNSNLDSMMQAGDVYKMEDILQFYSSPDGNGRLAYVINGELVMNDDVNYQEEFSTNILEQVVYANLPIFAAEYQDGTGIHKFGVFDVNDGYDVTGKTLEEIIKNSTINIDRMMNYSFVDADGESKFDENVELNLPQFNYRFNKGGVNSKPEKPSSPETPPCDDSSTPDTPVDEEEPTIPEQTEPSKPNPPCDDSSTPDTPVEEEEPTIPEQTEPSKPNPPCDDSSAPDIPVEEAPPSLPETVKPETPPCNDTPAQDTPVQEEKPVVPAEPQTPSNDSACGGNAYEDEVVEEEAPSL